MAATAILVDWCPRYLESDGTPSSLLLSPLGPGTLLQYLYEQVLDVDAQAPTVVPNFDYDEEYSRAIRAIVPDAIVTPPARFGELLEAHELSDWLLMVDARSFPTSGFELRALLRDTPDGQFPKHLVHLRRSPAGTRERVVYDDNYRVRAIQRLYEGVTQLEAAGVSASFLPVAAARRFQNPNPFCLTRLRTQLVGSGVPSQDIARSGATFDLTREEDLLALNERFTIEVTEAGVALPFVEHAPNIWTGPACKIHRTSRIYGPVILHAGVTLDAHAVVIGPAVLGAGARVGKHALVSQSLLGPNARVARRTSVVYRVRTADPGNVAPPSGRLGATWRLQKRALPAAPGRDVNGHQQPSGLADSRRVYPAVKRAGDFLAALLGLIVLSPLLLLVAALIKLTSRGPVLFGHEREGRGGKVFCCWKFRTMVDQAHRQQRALYKQNALDGPQFDVPNDPRITWLGGRLRVTNIDELPQLLNVLRGDMSLIGPRPSPFRENQICVPWRNARLSVRPGITGLWQVCRHDRSAGDFHQWIYFDMLYARHVSYWLDFRILAATFLTLAGRWSVPLNWMIPTRKLRPGTPTVGATVRPHAPATLSQAQAVARSSPAATTMDRRKPSACTNGVGEARASVTTVRPQSIRSGADE